MAINSFVLNLQDFIKTPLKVLSIWDFLPKKELSSAITTEETIETENRSESYFKDQKRLSDPLKNYLLPCPFDCCQKNLQSKYFSDSQLKNVTFKMRIGNSSSSAGNQVKGVPCLERRTIYEGRVPGPIRFDEFIKNSNSNDDRVEEVELEGNEDILITDRDHLKMTFHKETSTISAHSGGGGGNKEVHERRGHQLTGQTPYIWDTLRGGWTIAGQNKGINSNNNNRNNNSFLGAQSSTAEEHEEFWKYYNNSNNLKNSNAWRQQHQAQGHNQISISTPTRTTQQQSYTTTTSSVNYDSNKFSLMMNKEQAASGGTGSTSDLINPIMQKDEFIDQQLNNHLKWFKYIKPKPASSNAINNSNTSNYRSTSPPSSSSVGSGNLNDNNKVLTHLNAKSKVIFKQKPSSTLECRSTLSPRAALEQYERLKKYWDYQHQLLANSSGGNSMEVTSYGYGGPNSSAPQSVGPGGSLSIQQGTVYPYQNNQSGSSTQVSATLLHNRSQYGMEADFGVQHRRYSTHLDGNHPSYWNSGDSMMSRGDSFSYIKRKSVGDALNYSEGMIISQRPKIFHGKVTKEKQQMSPSSNPADYPVRYCPSPFTTSNTQQQQQQTLITLQAAAAAIPQPTVFRRKPNLIPDPIQDDNLLHVPKNLSAQAIIMPTGNVATTTTLTPRSKDIFNTTVTTTIDKEKDTPTDLSVRRNSDQEQPIRILSPERAKSASSIDTSGYDHIVLLDKRVMTFMCKRCLETLKSEQDIRNHLFCKMLNNTVQCHVCRNLFSTDEYPDHLKAHGVKN